MTARCPRLVIGGGGSGVGKTSLALGMVGALRRRGMRVQTFKVGPDFLDPSYLARASGRPCYNLDGWMTGRKYVRQLFARATGDADMAIVEGVMGLFDGASPSSLAGSTAEIAMWLKAPVLLVVNAHGMARSLAAIVSGFAGFEAEVGIAGVIANQTGGERHRKWLADALAAAELPPLVGAVPRDALPVLAGRHLGLKTADEATFSNETIERLADGCERHLDVDLILDLCKPAAALKVAAPLVAAARSGIRLGTASDAAFHFYYPDNLEMLQDRGVELAPFSPLKDRSLPADLNGLYFGGGYPELHAEQLAANRPMLKDVRAFCESGRPVYAECGGLMYLGRSLQTVERKRIPLAGVLPIDTAMLTRFKSLGYVEVALEAPCLWGEQGQTLRGHEFHYSHIAADDSAAQGWRRPYQLRRRRAAGAEAEGFQKGSVLASYVHLHFASNPGALDHFIERCEVAS